MRLIENLLVTGIPDTPKSSKPDMIAPPLPDAPSR